MKERNNPDVPWSHLVDIPQQCQTSGCEIKETHLRGMTIGMLQDLANLAQDVLEKGYVIVDKYTEESVPFEKINLHHLNDHFVKPLTKELNCSFAELVTTPEQSVKPPVYFVSHCWQTPLVNTIEMLKLHRKNLTLVGITLESKDDYVVWICAFCNCQHGLDGEGLASSDYKMTPFARALRSEHCRGTVMLLNEPGSLSPLTRSWCIFETFLSVTLCPEEKEQGHRMDVATIIPKGRCKIKDPIGIEDKIGNDRCAAVVYNCIEKDKGTNESAAHSIKMTTGWFGAWFPVEIAKQGLAVNVMKADASKVIDRENICRWVGEKEKEVNLALRKRFLPIALKAVCEEPNLELLHEFVEKHTSFISKPALVDMIHSMDLVFDLICSDNDKAAAPCLRYLLQLGCDANRPQSDVPEFGYPLGVAVYRKMYDCCRQLQEAGADPKNLTLYFLSMGACRKLPDDIEAFLRQGDACKMTFSRYCCPLAFCVGLFQLCCCCCVFVTTGVLEDRDPRRIQI